MTPVVLEEVGIFCTEYCFTEVYVVFQKYPSLVSEESQHSLFPAEVCVRSLFSYGEALWRHSLSAFFIYGLS